MPSRSGQPTRRATSGRRHRGAGGWSGESGSSCEIAEVTLTIGDRANLDRAARHGQPLSPADGLIQVLALEDHVAGDLLLGLGKRTVGDHDLAVLAAAQR